MCCLSHRKCDRAHTSIHWFMLLFCGTSIFFYCFRYHRRIRKRHSTIRRQCRDELLHDETALIQPMIHVDWLWTTAGRSRMGINLFVNQVRAHSLFSPSVACLFHTDFVSEENKTFINQLYYVFAIISVFSLAFSNYNYDKKKTLEGVAFAWWKSRVNGFAAKWNYQCHYHQIGFYQQPTI